MKSFIYTFEDDTSGLSLIIESELVDFDDGEPPEIMIIHISHCDISMEPWCFSEDYMNHLRNKVFQQWCSEVKRCVNN